MSKEVKFGFNRCEVSTRRWSWKFSLKPGRSTSCGILAFLRTVLLPIPDTSSNPGLWMVPAERITSSRLPQSHLPEWLLSQQAFCCSSWNWYLPQSHQSGFPGLTLRETDSLGCMHYKSAYGRIIPTPRTKWVLVVIMIGLVLTNLEPVIVQRVYILWRTFYRINDTNRSIDFQNINILHSHFELEMHSNTWTGKTSHFVSIRTENTNYIVRIIIQISIKNNPILIQTIITQIPLTPATEHQLMRWAWVGSPKSLPV